MSSPKAPRTSIWIIRGLTTLACLVVLLASRREAASAPELTPEQKSRVFGPPGTVVVKGRAARVRLEGTDRRGFYQCTYLRLTINGHGPFTFLYDTGASFTAVSSEVIRAAGIPLEMDRGGYHDLLRLASVRIGDVEIHDLTAVRDDGYGVDGVLGFRAFGDMNLTFDLRARELLVGSEPIHLSRSFELPYEMWQNVHPVIPVMIDTARVPILLDTGDDAYAFELKSEDLHGARLAHPPAPVGAVLNGERTQQTSISTLEVPARLGPITIERAVIGINDDLPVSDFGVEFLKDFRFGFDPKRMVVTFQPLSAASGRTIAGPLSPGFTLRFDPEGSIANVVPDSGAERLGMRPGDRILSVNGRTIQRWNPRTWDQALARRKPLAIRWRRGVDERSDRFEVRELR